MDTATSTLLAAVVVRGDVGLRGLTTTVSASPRGTVSRMTALLRCGAVQLDCDQWGALRFSPGESLEPARSRVPESTSLLIDGFLAYRHPPPGRPVRSPGLVACRDGPRCAVLGAEGELPRDLSNALLPRATGCRILAHPNAWAHSHHQRLLRRAAGSGAEVRLSPHATHTLIAFESGDVFHDHCGTLHRIVGEKARAIYAWLVAHHRTAAHTADAVMWQAADLMARGLTDAAAAAHLGITERQFRRYVARLMSHVGARSRFEAGLLVQGHAIG